MLSLLKMIEDCLVAQQVPSPVKGGQCQIESPYSGCRAIEYCQTGVYPEPPSPVNQTEDLKITKEVGIQCELLLCENQAATTSVAIQTSDDPIPGAAVTDVALLLLLLIIYIPILLLVFLTHNLLLVCFLKIH